LSQEWTLELTSLLSGNVFLTLAPDTGFHLVISAAVAASSGLHESVPTVPQFLQRRR
jgi:hypothetical protein